MTIFYTILLYSKFATQRASIISNVFFFFFNHTATTEIYTTEVTLSLHDALPISSAALKRGAEELERYMETCAPPERKLVALRSEEHTSELQSPSVISYAVFC